MIRAVGASIWAIQIQDVYVAPGERPVAVDEFDRQEIPQIAPRAAVPTRSRLEADAAQLVNAIGRGSAGEVDRCDDLSAAAALATISILVAALASGGVSAVTSGFLSTLPSDANRLAHVADIRTLRSLFTA